MTLLEAFNTVADHAALRDNVTPELLGDKAALDNHRRLLSQMEWLGGIPVNIFEILLSSPEPGFDYEAGFSYAEAQSIQPLPGELKKTDFFPRLWNTLKNSEPNDWKLFWMEWDQKPQLSAEDAIPGISVLLGEEQWANAGKVFWPPYYDHEAVLNVLDRSRQWFADVNLGITFPRSNVQTGLGFIPRSRQIAAELAKDRFAPLLQTWPAPCPALFDKTFCMLEPYFPGIGGVVMHLERPERLGVEFTLSNRQNPISQRKSGEFARFLNTLADIGLALPGKPRLIERWLGGNRYMDASGHLWLVIRYISHIKVDFFTDHARAKAYLAARFLPDGSF